MKQILYTVIFMVCLGIDAKAQQLEVVSLSLDSNDHSAQQYPQKDLNDQNCALVKVVFTDDIEEVEGNVIKPWIKKNNVTWVYMTQRSRQMLIKTEDYMPLMVNFSDYGIPMLKGGCTYVLKIQKAETSIVIMVNDFPIEMVKVEGGTFIMGATAEQHEDALDNESPTHRVTLSTFYMGKYEVTQNLWFSIMNDNPSGVKGGDMPVEYVNWEKCMAFISKLDSITGRKFRLPTEAEWEFACRGGVKNKGYKYSGSNDVNEVAWHYVNSYNQIHEVGTKRPNELGIYDMSGNVNEWCQDYYEEYTNTPQTNPIISSGDFGHVFRGGGTEDKLFCRSSSRRGGAYGSSGLRLALSE